MGQTTGQTAMHNDVHLVVRTWVRQLLDLDPAVVALIDSGQVEIRLRSNKGKVRTRPTILLDAGPTSMIEP